MGKDKLKKWAENKTFSHVYEPELMPIIKEGATFMKGEWHQRAFGNAHPLVLELGCGKGEYTVGLARLHPNCNFLGVDVKGHRFHKGAKEALEEGLTNVAFLRTRIEFIESFFAKDEVDEIWLTFSDPQPKDKVGVRRITSKFSAENYRSFLNVGGCIHIKHDHPDVYEMALAEFGSDDRYAIEVQAFDIYGSFMSTLEPYWQEVLNFKTYYEQMWLAEGRKTKYIRIRLVK
ncbi:MAG: tRNA (guanosine(46)-N7)-methyltransferase TrmB [Flavobacteriales bacterium]